MLALMQIHENGHYVPIHLSEDEDCRDAGEQFKEVAEDDPDVYKLVYVSDLEDLKKAMYKES